MSAGNGLRCILQSKQCKSRNGGRKAKTFIHPKSRCVKQLVRKAAHKVKIEKNKIKRRMKLRASQAESNADMPDSGVSDGEVEMGGQVDGSCGVDDGSSTCSYTSRVQECPVDQADCDSDGDTLL